MSLSCGIIYGMLGNIAINGLENAVRKEIPARKIINGSLPKVNIIIFGSAIIVTGVSIAILNKVKLIIENFLISRSGSKSEIIKTRIVSIYDLPLPLHIYICRGGSPGLPWAPLGSPGLPWAPLGSPGLPWAPLLY